MTTPLACDGKMPRLARGEYLDPNEVQVVHAIQRCVRRAFLCGIDPYSNSSYEHRRVWIRKRIEFLASVFGVDVLTYAVLSNHMHMVLRSRPDVVKTWTDEEVAGRWLRLSPGPKDKNGSPVKPIESQLNMIINDPKKLAEIRTRLSDVSWWMKCTAEKIARQANREDQCTGRFWEGRYKAQLILDEASLLACAAYVDLNPVRAAIAKTPRTSTFTGIKDRINDMNSSEKSKPLPKSTHAWERNRKRGKSGWLSPIEIREASDPSGPDADPSKRRPSLKGFLSMSLNQYLELLDWTCKNVTKESSGNKTNGKKLPVHLKPILSRLGFDETGWCQLVKGFGKLFKRAAGTLTSLQAEAKRRGQSVMHGPGASHFIADDSVVDKSEAIAG